MKAPVLAYGPPTERELSRYRTGRLFSAIIGWPTPDSSWFLDIDHAEGHGELALVFVYFGPASLGRMSMESARDTLRRFLTGSGHVYRVLFDRGFYTDERITYRASSMLPSPLDEVDL